MPLLTRERLTRRLSESSNRAVLIVAGSGFGKSVAVRQFCDGFAEPIVHYEVRADAFVPFVRGFVESAAQLAPGLKASFAGAIEFAMQSSKPHDEIALWMLDHFKSANVRAIAIEDIHRACADERVGKLIVALLADSPGRIRWILATRELHTLPYEAIEQAGIDAVRITGNDLRLTPGEAREIALTSGLPDEHRERLLEVTAGHPAAFHFGAYVFEPRDLPGDDAYQFYASRYFERCAPDLRALLLGMCVLDEIDEDLVKRSQWAGAAHYVASLAADGLIFSRLTGGRYRFHEPFRSLLLDRLGGPQVRRDYEQGCALMLEARGDVARALELYVSAEDAVNARRLCEEHGLDLADHGRIDLLRRAFNCIGEAELHESAALLALKAVSESLAGRTDTAEAWYLHSLRLAQEPELRATISYRYAVDLIRQGRAEAVTLLEPYTKQTLKPELAALVHSTLATAYVVATRFDEARAVMQSALNFIAASDSVTLHASIQHQVGWVALFTGDIAAAKQYASRAVELALSSALYDTAARAYSVLYNITYEVEDDVRASLDVLNSIWDCGLKAGDVRVRLFALAGSFDVAAELGDTETLVRMERLLEAHEVDYADPVVSETLLPGQALRIAATGDFVEAFRLISPTAESQITGDRRALRFAEIALYAAAAGYAQETRTAIARALDQLDDVDPRLRRAMRTNAILAVALYLIGRRSDALQRLNDVSSAGEHASLRIRGLTQALKVLFERWEGAENFDRVLDTLEALRASDFGGLAAVLAALPYRLPLGVG